MPSRAANHVQVVQMCDAMAELGIDVRLIYITSNDTGELETESPFAGVGVRHEIPCVGIKNSGQRVRNAFLQVSAAAESDCTHVYTRALECAYFASLLGLPTSLELHRPIEELGWPMAREIFRMNSFKSLVVISEALRQYTCDAFPQVAQATIVAPSAAASIASKGAHFELREIGGCKVTVGYAGQLYAGKGAKVLVQLAARLPDVGFHVLGGDDRELELWKPLAPRNIVFYGYRPHSEVAAFLQAVDILIAPYLRKVFVHGGRTEAGKWMSPLKLFEYMAAEKPIVCSDLPVLREILHHETTALLCDPDCIDDWVTAIGRLRQDAQLASFLASNARKEFIERHTWQARAQTVIRPLLSQGSETSVGAPPRDPRRWSRPRWVLAATATSTLDRLVPRQVFRTKEQFCLLCEMRHVDTGKTRRPVLSAGLFFSSDLENWQESSANPVLADGNAFGWQNNRAMAEWLTRDEYGGWLLFFCGASSRDRAVSGERVIALARSSDGVRWQIDPHPVLTIDSDGLRNWRSPGADRVYCRGVQFIGGWWHMMVNCGQKGGPYVTGVVVSKRPEGPWYDSGGNPIADTALQSPVWHNGRWYATQSSTAEATVRLASSETLVGKWSITSEPIVIAEANVDGCVLINRAGHWTVIGGFRHPPEGLWISHALPSKAGDATR
jgi:glycosyltransferase involved in cell wall biosynthesis